MEIIVSVCILLKSAKCCIVVVRLSQLLQIESIWSALVKRGRHESSEKKQNRISYMRLYSINEMM